MLKYKTDDDSFYMISHNIVPSEEQFDTVNRRILEKQQHLEDVKNELDLLHKQAFELYTSHVMYFKFDAIDVPAVREWITCLQFKTYTDGSKLNLRKKYPEKDKYNLMIAILEDVLGVYGIQVTEIVQYGARNEANEFHFAYKNQEWILYVPIIRNISFQSYMELGSGHIFKLGLYHHKHPTQELIGESFEEDDIAEFMNLGLKKFIDREE